LQWMPIFLAPRLDEHYAFSEYTMAIGAVWNMIWSYVFGHLNCIIIWLSTLSDLKLLWPGMGPIPSS
jgi:hypothetical protein